MFDISLFERPFPKIFVAATLPISTPVPISVHVGMMKTSFDISGRKCQIDTPCRDYNLRHTKCGKHCWTSVRGDYFEYTFTGDKFQVYGSKNTNHGEFELYLDGTLIETIDENSLNRKSFVLLYTSDILSVLFCDVKFIIR